MSAHTGGFLPPFELVLIIATCLYFSAVWLWNSGAAACSYQLLFDWCYFNWILSLDLSRFLRLRQLVHHVSSNKQKKWKKRRLHYWCFLGKLRRRGLCSRWQAGDAYTKEVLKYHLISEAIRWLFEKISSPKKKGCCRCLQAPPGFCRCCQQYRMVPC